MYYLRSSIKKKNESQSELSYIKSSPGNMISNKTLKIYLNRIPILENPENHKSTFHINNDKIGINKKNDTSIFGLKEKIIIILLLIVSFTLIFYYYFKDSECKFGAVITDKILKLPGKISYSISMISSYFQLIVTFAKNELVFGNSKISKTSKKRKKKRGVSYYDIRDFVKEDFSILKNKHNFIEQSTLSFIDEQCRKIEIRTQFADNLKIFNSSLEIDVDSLPDYAFHAKGAKILSTFDAEPYAGYRIQFEILDNIIGVKYFYIDDWICRFFSVLCNYFMMGPSYVLQSWKSPGECWSFKGSHGRVRIELSNRIYITAISMEHIPISQASFTDIDSAPKQFSLVGIDDLDYDTPTYLGTYEYQLSEPNIQMFSLLKEYSGHPYKIIELNIESNHGNNNYTCVYRFRVHGHL